MMFVRLSAKGEVEQTTVYNFSYNGNFEHIRRLVILMILRVLTLSVILAIKCLDMRIQFLAKQAIQQSLHNALYT